MRWRTALVVGLAVVVAVGCNQQPVEPQSDQVAEVATLNFMNGPEQPGNSGVERWHGWRHWTSTTDPVRGLWASHYQADDRDVCLTLPIRAAWDVQLVEKGNGGATANAQLRDAPLLIYDRGDAITACVGAADREACCEFMATQYLYKGTHDATANDNSYWDTEDQKQNVWQFKAHGVVYDGDGNKYRYREHQQAFYDFDASQTIWTLEDIVVR